VRVTTIAGPSERFEGGEAFARPAIGTSASGRMLCFIRGRELLWLGVIAHLNADGAACQQSEACGWGKPTLINSVSGVKVRCRAINRIPNPCYVDIAKFDADDQWNLIGDCI